MPGFFGLNRAMTVFAARTRWRMVALAAGCVAASVAWGALTGRAEVGVASRFGAAWLYDGKPVEHWSWGVATSVGRRLRRTSATRRRVASRRR
ncbi:hypothetical protein ACRAWD_06615 [Caulobacter segnis]